MADPTIDGGARRDATRRLTARRHDLHMLWLSGAIVAAAFLLDVRIDGRVGARWSDGLNLPESCISRQCLGVSCPACGMTRSFVHLARGDLAASCAIHHLGWLVAAMVLSQFPYRTALLLWPSWSPTLRRIAGIVSWIAPAALLINWLLGGVAPVVPKTPQGG